MKRTINILFGLIFCSVLSAQDSIRVSLAEWTFDQWYGGGVLPPGVSPSSTLFADNGKFESVAKFGTEQMFSGGSITRIWDVPTTGGYVRCSKNWTAGSKELYYMITGINTVGASTICLTSSHATSSSSQVYSLKVQYRLSSTGSWKDIFGPFSVTDITDSGISKKQVNNVKLPKECNNVSYIDIRWLCTTFPPSSTTQFRIDNIYLTASVKNPDLYADKSPLTIAQSLNETDWAIPSWTLLLTARKTATDAPVSTNLVALTTVMSTMLSKEMPYCINATFNGDPTSSMAFDWFTNSNVSGEQVQLVAKENATLTDFTAPFKTVNATPAALTNVNYVVAANDPTFTANMPANTKHNYISDKALVSGLTPNTSYSYRVGKPGAWSSIRSFRTAKNSKDEFSFIYITDTQANSNDNFDCSSKTLTEAYAKAINPLFVYVGGDLVESQGSSNSEWEYEQFFESMENVWSRLPLVAALGNHDASSSNNFFHHFNNDVSYNQNASVKTTMDGTVYSFVVGDALFMVVNHEDVSVSGYLTSLGNWMTQQVNAYPGIHWRIVCVHSGLFAGGGHQEDDTNITLRNALLPLYQSLKIDLTLQGHDHVYNTIGPVNNLTKTPVPGSVQNVGSAPAVEQSNMNGKTGGTFDVTNGTFYFINNSTSRKKYAPNSQSTMISDASITQVNNYWNLFTGRFAQTGEPTFSNIRVTTDTIFISTYAINNLGISYLFDQIKVTKHLATNVNQIHSEQTTIDFNRNNNQIIVNGTECLRIELYDIKGQLIVQNKRSNYISTSSLTPGIYIVRAYGQVGIYNRKIEI